MKTIYAKHLPYKNGHYPIVYHEMVLNDDGPILRVIQMGKDEFCAVEGSHRLASAHSQNKPPRLIVLEPDEDGLPTEWWENVKKTLPSYQFESVFVMNERDFNE